MSILIKGMEMPDMCSECDFCGGLICPDNIYCCDCPSDAIYGKNITRAIEEDCRHPDCPLVPVPPHGELCDKTAFIDKICENIDKAKDRSYDWWYACTVAYDFALVAPTIIPAEEAPAEDTNVPTYDLLYEEGGAGTT